MQPRHGALETAAQDWVALRAAEPLEDGLAQELVAPDVDPVPGAKHEVIDLPRAAVRERQLQPAPGSGRARDLRAEYDLDLVETDLHEVRARRANRSVGDFRLEVARQQPEQRWCRDQPAVPEGTDIRWRVDKRPDG